MPNYPSINNILMCSSSLLPCSHHHIILQKSLNMSKTICTHTYILHITHKNWKPKKWMNISQPKKQITRFTIIHPNPLIWRIKEKCSNIMIPKNVHLTLSKWKLTQVKEISSKINKAFTQFCYQPYPNPLPYTYTWLFSKNNEQFLIVAMLIFFQETLP